LNDCLQKLAEEYAAALDGVRHSRKEMAARIAGDW